MIASEDQASSCLGDETVILDLARGLYYELDLVGTLVWELVQEPVAIASVCRAVSEAFGIDAAQAEQDMLPFLNDLASQGLLTVREGAVRDEQAAGRR